MTVTTQKKTPASAAIEALEASLGGQVLTPHSDGYDQARELWNGMIDRRPAIIVQPTGVSDIQRAVGFAREHELPLSIKGGGHNVAGHALVDGGLTLDMSGMRAVDVNPRARTARVQAGATWADFDRETGVFGLATTGGVISTTGVAGLTLGGGVGWLVGKHGLAIDNLLSVDLVTAEGEFITASATEHPDLFWALRGGGGNFGVVTTFEFQLHPLRQVLSGMVAYPPNHARDVLEFYRDFTATAPDELGVYAALMADPESGQRVAGFAICYTGDNLSMGDRVLAPLLDFGSPVVQMVGPMPYPAWQSANNPLFPHGRRYYWKGDLLEEIPDQVIDAMVEHAADPKLPWLNASIEFYAGAMNRVGVTETAYPHRDARYQLVNVGAWDDPSDDDEGIAWARTLHRAAEPFSTNRAFLSFNSEDHDPGGERVRAAYGPNLERLVAVKRIYDPTNFFRANANIDPDWDRSAG